jgi:hypothetical protein
VSVGDLARHRQRLCLPRDQCPGLHFRGGTHPETTQSTPGIASVRASDHLGTIVVDVDVPELADGNPRASSH